MRTCCWWLSWVGMLLAGAAVRAAELTDIETRWLAGARPVLGFAREARLPLDIVVQPQDTPGAAPLALGFVDGRCKLVLSMRGNPEAQATLERLDPEWRDAALELMAAHELAHCRRYAEGAWYALPAGFAAAAVPPGLEAQTRADYLAMQATRREEAYADLVGLAWTARQHPQRYAALHAWLVRERSADLIPGSHHDTLAWLRRASDAAVFADGSIFVAAARVWAAGLAAD